MIKPIRALLASLPLLILGCTQGFDAASKLQDKQLVVTAHFDDTFTAIYQGMLDTKTKTLDISQWQINQAVSESLAKSLSAQGYNATSGAVLKPGDLRVAIMPATYADYIRKQNRDLTGIGVYRLYEMVDEHVIAFTSYKIVVLDGETPLATMYGQFKLDMGVGRWGNEKYWEQPSSSFPAGVEGLYRQVVIKHFETLYPFSLPQRPPSRRKTRS